MTTAVRRMFGDMWLAFGQTPFDETPDHPRLGIIRFLTRFDAIFTLNQDTLLETHYLPVVRQEDFAKNTYQGPRNMGAHRPGLVPAMDELTFGSLASRRSKEADIAKYPLLESYHEQFRWRLNSPGARLMIIGYSFADHHINKTIFDAILNGLKLFLVGPEGAMGISSNPNVNPGQNIKDAIVGASSRPIRNTLSGRDMVELMKIERFFMDGRMAFTTLPSL
jgi:hypothetical protein